AAAEFLKTLEKINRELGTSILLSEHRLEEAFPLAGRVLVMDEGKIVADGTPARVGAVLKESGHPMYQAMPSPMRIYHALSQGDDCPVTVREGRAWLEAFAEHKTVSEFSPMESGRCKKEILALDDLWFRYDKEGNDVIKGLSLTVCEGEILALLGDNGTGKTTALSLIANLQVPYRGRIRYKGQELSKIRDLYRETLGYLPQNPQILFVKKSVRLDLLDMLDRSGLSADEKEERVRSIARLCRIESLFSRHPYDLSGGEQQRVALAKILLKEPSLLLLDEPTKGFDAQFKNIFAQILMDLKNRNVTVIMVSHDVEFCAEYADRCGLFFDGDITALAEPREFFAGNHFYTTATNRMARSVMPWAVLPADVISAFGGVEECVKQAAEPVEIPIEKEEGREKSARKVSVKKVFGILFVLAFLLLSALQVGKVLTWDADITNLLSGVLLAGCFLCLLPKGEGATIKTVKQKKLSRRSILAAVLILVTIPITVLIGTFYLEDKKYSFITFLMILQTM
ncbi:MAG: ATP-binding cassette domain-containing protein, partial [Clostridia bacterium]|nr:ATP-binding cassette domain-containing protein [Clostridia bacterium]